MDLEARRAVVEGCRVCGGLQPVQHSSQPRPGGPTSSNNPPLLQVGGPLATWFLQVGGPITTRSSKSNHPDLMKTTSHAPCHPQAGLLDIPGYSTPWDGYWAILKSSLSDILVKNTPPGASCQTTNGKVLNSKKVTVSMQGVDAACCTQKCCELTPS